MPLAVTAYLVAKAVHIIAALLAFGVPVAYPILIPFMRRSHPRAMPAVHAMQNRLNQWLTGPFIGLLFVLGAYMASKNHLWGEAWLLVALGALAVITVVGLAVIQPATAGLSELARADVDATAAGATVAWSDGYRRLYARYMAAEVLLGALVLIAVFFMTAKPFA